MDPGKGTHRADDLDVEPQTQRKQVLTSSGPYTTLTEHSVNEVYSH